MTDRERAFLGITIELRSLRFSEAEIDDFTPEILKINANKMVALRELLRVANSRRFAMIALKNHTNLFNN